MTTRDTLERILELHEAVKELEDKITELFNKVYYDELKRQREKKCTRK